jgi:hypothetical protein
VLCAVYMCSVCVHCLGLPSYLEWIGGCSVKLSNLETLSLGGAMNGTIPAEMYVCLELTRCLAAGAAVCDVLLG